MTPDQWIAFFAGIVGGALRVGTPFLFVSLGECLTEKSGRINLGLEGVLVLSATTSKRELNTVSAFCFSNASMALPPS